MDYGQHSQSGPKASDDALFAGAITEGVGIKPENTNPDVAESLHSDDQSISWQRGPREIGSKIINFPGDITKESELSQDQGQFGVIEPTMPPGTGNSIIDSTQPSQDKMIEASFDRTSIKTTGDGLDTAGIKELEKVADSKLYKNDDAAGYVDAIRGEDGMAFTNLENSYGADSAWKKAAWQTTSVFVKITTIDFLRGR